MYGKTQTERSVPPLIAEGETNLFWVFLDGFAWLNNSLQSSLKEHGWPSVSVTESQILILVSLGVTRPTDLASSLGLSKQAINKACKKLLAEDLIKFEPDPNDRRSKIIAFNEKKTDMHLDAQWITEELEKEFANRIGAGNLKRLYSMMKHGIGKHHVVTTERPTKSS